MHKTAIIALALLAAAGCKSAGSGVGAGGTLTLNPKPNTPYVYTASVTSTAGASGGWTETLKFGAKSAGGISVDETLSNAVGSIAAALAKIGATAKVTVDPQGKITSGGESNVASLVGNSLKSGVLGIVLPTGPIDVGKAWKTEMALPDAAKAQLGGVATIDNTITRIDGGVVSVDSKLKAKGASKGTDGKMNTAAIDADIQTDLDAADGLPTKVVSKQTTAATGAVNMTFTTTETVTRQSPN